MSLKIHKIVKEDDAIGEHIILKATEYIEDLSGYILFDRTFDKKGKVSNLHQHFFRFPAVEILKDEYVALFTAENKKDEIGRAHV